MIVSARARAELFNKHFLNKSTFPANLPMLPALEVSSHPLSAIMTNEDEVQKILTSLNVNKTSGYDNINNKLL